MRLTLIVLLCLSGRVLSQIPVGEDELMVRLTPGKTLPENLLSTRSVVFYPYTMPLRELDVIQEHFQRVGIDAVMYVESDLMAAGRDPSVALAEYMNAREISNLIIFERPGDGGFQVSVAAYNRMATLVEQGEQAWQSKDKTLPALLQQLLRATNNPPLKRENLLVNEFPELAMPVNVFKGRRSDFFAIDLKVDPLAVPKFGNEEMDRELEEIMKAYPYKYKLTEPGLSETQIRQDGSYYVLRFVHARDKTAQDILGYDAPRSQSAIVSVTYPQDKVQLKNIPANTPVYKFYFKHIDSGNIFLGTKWDADLTWQQALINQLRAFKAELKIN